MKTNSLANHVSTLWNVMSATGKGYRRHSLRHTGIDKDRRNDKLKEVAFIDDDGQQKLEWTPFEPAESKLQRCARLSSIGLHH